MPKAEKKKQEKIIEDRTFGLKNKNKSKTVQKFIKGVEQTVKNQGKPPGMLQAEQFDRKKIKKKQEEEAALLNALYGQANRVKKHGQLDSDQQDPKNTVCPYFKQGLCNRGKKCIYSHDLTLDRTDEIDLYVDQRTQLMMNEIGGKGLITLGEDELNKMITDKQSSYKGSKSDLVCKHFLDAVQKSKYGWNWTCPNGDEKCQYKHCLPPGYKLKKDIPKVAQQDIDLEAKIDEERNNFLNQNTGSPLVTYEIFLKWKAAKLEKKAAEAEKKKEDEKKKVGKNMRTGRQLFTYDPTLFIDDQQAAADYDDRQQQPEVEQEEEGEGQLRQQVDEDENEDEDEQQQLEQKTEPIREDPTEQAETHEVQ